MIRVPKCEKYKEEFINLCDSHGVKYTTETTDTHIIVHAKIERDFVCRQHLKNDWRSNEDNT